ncbi:MAG TPA: DUF6515 family protein [Candidatus Dormibacteraeota bacterium]|nr:DUF6515 family protein [Candidatus Dormibacteraeota bacterium]
MKSTIYLSALLGIGLVQQASAAQWSSLRGANHGNMTPSAGATRSVAPTTRTETRTTTVQRSQPTVVTPTGRRDEHEQDRGRVEGNRQFERGRETERAHEVNRNIVVDRGRNERIVHERRRLDIGEDRRAAYRWSHYHPGMFVNVLPGGYRPLYFGGITYYYDDGTYYEPGPSGYQVVAPPVGAVVPALPEGTEMIYAPNGATLYYGAGAFYAPVANGFQLIPPPMGATVDYLPPDAVSTMLNGVLFYTARGVYYRPVMQDGVTVYMVTQP